MWFVVLCVICYDVGIRIDYYVLEMSVGIYVVVDLFVYEIGVVLCCKCVE